MASASTISDYSSAEVAFAKVHPRPRILAAANIALAACFIVAIFVPLIGTAFHWDPASSTENRTFARFPQWPKNFKDVQHLSETTLDYFRDHFGFRNTLIHGVTLINYHGGLNIDQKTGVIIGKNGWLFYPSHGTDVLADRNLDPFTPAEVDDWVHLIEQRRIFCEAHHIAFILVIPPDKQTVYPEYLPDKIKLLGKESRLDQLAARLREVDPGLHFIDLRPTLAAAKKYHQIYFKTDTHWNDFGGYAAYPAIIDEVNKALPWAKIKLQPDSEFIPRTTIHSGDLAFSMNLYYEYNEDWMELVKRHPFPPIVKAENPYLPVITEGNPYGPALYMLHDSFTLRLKDFIGPHFSRACWQWGTVLYGDKVLEFKPDIVIDEFLERVLYIDRPQDPPIVADAKLP